MKTLRIRPHHILDIVTHHGANGVFEPMSNGNANHTIAEIILADTDVNIELVKDLDDICKPCSMVDCENRCIDILDQLEEKVYKQDYNDSLDEKLFKYFGITPGTQMTMAEYCKMVKKVTPGIEVICTHPKEDQKQRLENLIKGLDRLIKNT